MGLWRALTGRYTPPLPKEGGGEAQRFKVAGTSFDGRQAAVAQIAQGDRLKIVRETRNSFDDNAVRLVADAGTVGYVPREVAAVIAPILDSGASARAAVASVSKGSSGYPREAWAYIWISSA